MNVWLGVVVTVWLCAGILIGAWVARRDEVIDLRERLGPPLDAPGDPHRPPAPTEVLEGDSDEPTVRNH